MRYLTVLDLNRTSIRSLPGSIGDLKNLKYLNLCGCTSIRMLPRSLSGLKRLQFLDVSYCRRLKRLHSRIGEHKFLLHLNMKGCRRLRSLPVGISKLISLHTLKGARISMSKKAANALQLKDLKGLTLLQQLSLLIFGGDNETSRRTTQLEEGIFMGMTKMRILEVFNHNSSFLHLPQDMSVMERLEIVRLHGCKLPKWVFRLQNLNELKSCRDQSSDYGGLEKLRNLRTLHLSKNEKCVEFTEVFREAGAFPKLQKLSIEYFKSLKIFPPLNDDAMPSLKYLRITGCDKFVERPERFEGMERMEEEQDLERHNLPSELDTSLNNCFAGVRGLMFFVPCCWLPYLCFLTGLCIKTCLEEEKEVLEEEEEEEKNSKKEKVEKDEEEKNGIGDEFMFMLCAPCCWLPMLCCMMGVCIKICLEQEKGVEKEEEEEKNNKKEEVEKDEEEEKKRDDGSH